ncbi:SCO6745 family protein [Pilimelia columellifera]|uniref:EvbL n=1 Tax=Pilimelia columellifera subsp. columellifera TaxID=706583 RepID=A0ABP6AUR0_9ACTN
MTPEHAAAASRIPTQWLGSAYIDCPMTVRRARRWGLSGWSFHVASRGGVLGEASADTVAAALGFFAPDLVRDAWDAARRVRPPVEIAAQSIAECCRWGTEHLDGFVRVRRLIDLAAPVVRNADGAGLPLFVAWRSMPSPDVTPGARAAVLLHLLRELRLGAHLIAVRAAGLSPVESILGGPDGERGAAALGWAGPYPPGAPLVRRRVWSDQVADSMVGRAMAGLTPAERGELVDLLHAAWRRCEAAATRQVA